MQVSVEATSDSSRKMTVQVPEEEIQEVVATRMKNLARTAKVSGFRPGKVPQSVLQNKFGGQVRTEALAEIIRSSFDDALKSEKLKLLGQPTITPHEAAEGKGLEYEASFDIFPDIPLDTLDQLEIERPTCGITDATIDTVIERLREQKKTWHGVDRCIQDHDRVTIQFEGKVGEETATDGLIENFAVVIGSKQMIPGFEAHLLGAESGAHLKFEIELAPDYADKKLAGKTVEFEVDVIKTEEGRLPEIDKAFFEAFGVEDGQLDTFRAEVKSSAEHQIGQAIRQRLKTAVMNALHERIPVAVPDRMVEREIDQLVASAQGAGRAQEGELQKILVRDQCRELAKRRVALGLIMSEISNVAELKADPARVRSIIEELAQNYPKPEELVNFYNERPERRQAIEQMDVEDQVVAWVLARARVTDRTFGFDELMNSPENQPSVS
jgi:trigger factor